MHLLLARAAHFFLLLVPLGSSAACCISFAGSEKNPKINRIIRNNLLRIFEILGFVELILQIRCAFDTQQCDCQGVFQCKENKKKSSRFYIYSWEKHNKTKKV